MKISASCVLGAERVLATELAHLGIEPTGRSAGRINFDADETALCRALVGLRTADRLFLEAASFRASDFDALFEGVRSIHWEQWLSREDRLVIEKARSSRSRLAAQNAIQSVCQKAAYERLCGEYGVVRMPETGHQINARIRLEQDTAVVEIDLSGQPLSKRGYRKNPTEAPLKETVAAAALFIAGWKCSLPLYDPFCGSGTIPIEAALYALDIAPGLGRSFTWETMPAATRQTMADTKEAARSAVRMDREIVIAGSDSSRDALRAATLNAGLAGLEKAIRFFEAKAEHAAPFASKGLVLTDPPYGKRLGTPEEADALYHSLGAFSDRFAGWQLGFIVDREDFRLDGPPVRYEPSSGHAEGNRADKASAHHATWRKTRLIDGAETRWLQRRL